MEKIIKEVSKIYGLSESYLKQLPEKDLMRFSFKINSWNNYIDNNNQKNEWERKRILEIEDNRINNKDSVIKTGDKLLLGNDVLDFDDDFENLDGVPCVRFTDVFDEWYEFEVRRKK